MISKLYLAIHQFTRWVFARRFENARRVHRRLCECVCDVGHTREFTWVDAICDVVYMLFKMCDVSTRLHTFVSATAFMWFSLSGCCWCYSIFCDLISLRPANFNICTHSHSRQSRWNKKYPSYKHFFFF